MLQAVHPQAFKPQILQHTASTRIKVFKLILLVYTFKC